MCTKYLQRANSDYDGAEVIYIGLKRIFWSLVLCLSLYV